jgi:hypothetical protein
MDAMMTCRTGTQAAVSLVAVTGTFVQGSAAQLPVVPTSTRAFRLAIFASACLDQSGLLAIISAARFLWLGGASVVIARISHLVAGVPFARINCL